MVLVSALRAMAESSLECEVQASERRHTAAAVEMVLEAGTRLKEGIQKGLAMYLVQEEAEMVKFPEEALH